MTATKKQKKAVEPTPEEKAALAAQEERDEEMARRYAAAIILVEEDDEEIPEYMLPRIERLPIDDCWIEMCGMLRSKLGEMIDEVER